LMVPMALGQGGRYRTSSPLTLHSITNAEVIQKFLNVEICFIEMEDDITEVTIQPIAQAANALS
jgi:RNA 3'-terminal phosphate cyclase